MFFCGCAPAERKASLDSLVQLVPLAQQVTQAVPERQAALGRRANPATQVLLGASERQAAQERLEARVTQANKAYKVTKVKKATLEVDQEA